MTEQSTDGGEDGDATDNDYLEGMARVMTYNIRYANPNDGDNVWENRRDPVATAIRFHRPDIIGLQEALPHQLEDLKEQLPDFDWLAAGRRDESVAGEYVPIGYRRNRYNCQNDGYFWLCETPDEPGPGWDAALPRMVRYAYFHDKQTGVDFTHFNTHFDHRGEISRRESAMLLRSRIDELSPEGPLVVTGDFNCRESTEPYRILTESGSFSRSLTDSHQISRFPHHGPSTSMTDFQDLIPEKKIDFVLVSDGVKVINHGSCSDTYDNGHFPSDHLPVITDALLS